MLFACLALTVAPEVVRMASRIAPYLTGEAGPGAKDNFQSGSGPQSNANHQVPMQTSYELDAKKIKSLDGSKKLSEVKDLIKDLKLKWGSTTGPYYSWLMFDICKALNSLDFGDKGQYELAYTNAIETLAQPHRFPDDPEQKLETETGLVLCLNRDLRDPSWIVSPDWKMRRRINAEKFLSLWQRISNSIDPNFNFKDRALLNVPAPLGSGVSAGSDPASITNPEKRVEYEAALQANREKSRTYNFQQRLRTLAAVLEPHLKGYLVAAFSMEPSGKRELQELLSQYQVDDVLSSEITKALNNSTSN
jgi:hypothetical protein